MQEKSTAAGVRGSMRVFLVLNISIIILFGCVSTDKVQHITIGSDEKVVIFDDGLTDSIQILLEKNIGPWQVLTIPEDNGNNFLVLARKNWGMINIDSFNNSRSVIVQQHENERFDGIVIRDTDKDGQFDKIEFTSISPKLTIHEANLKDGRWTIKEITSDIEENENSAEVSNE